MAKSEVDLGELSYQSDQAQNPEQKGTTRSSMFKWETCSNVSKQIIPSSLLRFGMCSYSVREKPSDFPQAYCSVFAFGGIC